MLNSYKAGFVILIALAVVTTGYYELAVRDNIGNQLLQDNSNGTLNLFVYDYPGYYQLYRRVITGSKLQVLEERSIETCGLQNIYGGFPE